MPQDCGNIEEFLVEERHTPLHAPCRQTLVSTKTVVEMEFGKLPYGFLVKVLCRRRLMEIKIATENLIGTFTGKHHLDAHRLDYASQQVHRCRGTDGGDIIGLNIIDNIPNGVKTFLNGIVDFVMNRTDMVGY